MPRSTVIERLEVPGVFQSFAANICQERLDAVARDSTRENALGPEGLLPRLSEDEEAQLLGVERQTAMVR